MSNQVLFLVLIPLLCQAPTPRDTLVRQDRRLYGQNAGWIYNDLDRGLEQARTESKPLLVVFRCIPCEACKKFDEEVASRDAGIRDLMDRFVGVRLTSANRIDLTRFRHDFDQSFAVYFLRPDGKILGRYGTRSGRPESSDMDIEGFRAAMTRVLALFESGEEVDKWIDGKQAPSDGLRTPEDFPSLAGKFPPTIDYEGATAKSCLHCHQVGEALRLTYRERDEPIPDEVLFPYPDPSVLGLSLSARDTALILGVEPDSTAARDGFRAGDRILRVNGQPLVSVADLQWILHRAEAPAILPVEVERDGATASLNLSLEPGFRRKGDLSWRVTTWDLRRMALGGMRLDEMLRAERRALGIDEDRLALRVRHVGQYGEHAVAKKAGVKEGDVLVGYDGQSSRWTETELIAYALQKRKRGDEIRLRLLRDGQVIETTIRLQ